MILVAIEREGEQYWPRAWVEKALAVIFFYPASGQFEQVLHLAVQRGGYLECQNGGRDVDTVFNRVDTFARHLCHYGKFLLGEPRSSAVFFQSVQ